MTQVKQVWPAQPLDGLQGHAGTHAFIAVGGDTYTLTVYNGTGFLSDKRARIIKSNPEGSQVWREFVPLDGTEAENVSLDARYVKYSHLAIDKDLGFAVAGLSTDGVHLTKFDPAGNKQWSKKLGSFSNNTVENIAVDSLGNIYLSGNTNGSVLGLPAGSQITNGYLAIYSSNGNLSSLVDTGSGSIDAMTAKDGLAIYAQNGNLFRVNQKGQVSAISNLKTIVNSSNEYSLNVKDIAISDNGTIYLCGFVPYQGYFLLALDSNGSQKWIRTAPNTDGRSFLRLDTDTENSVYVSGSNNRGFVAKYRENGSEVWSEILDYLADIDVSNTGNLYALNELSSGINITEISSRDSVTGINEYQIIPSQTGRGKIRGTNEKEIFSFGNPEGLFGKKNADKIINFDADKDKIGLPSEYFFVTSNKMIAKASSKKELKKLSKTRSNFVYLNDKYLYFNGNGDRDGLSDRKDSMDGGLLAIFKKSPALGASNFIEI
jgi:hypothetical protein